jgi:hypothetical protein
MYWYRLQIKWDYNTKCCRRCQALPGRTKKQFAAFSDSEGLQSESRGIPIVANGYQATKEMSVFRYGSQVTTNEIGPGRLKVYSIYLYRIENSKEL